MSLFKKSEKNKTERNNRFFAVCGIVEMDGKLLLVRHTYGTAKDRILLPGGYVKENEIPTISAEREILEETGVACKSKELYCNHQYLCVYGFMLCRPGDFVDCIS